MLVRAIWLEAVQTETIRIQDIIASSTNTCHMSERHLSEQHMYLSALSQFELWVTVTTSPRVYLRMNMDLRDWLVDWCQSKQAL